MKDLTFFFGRCTILATVFVITYVTPAIIAFVITFNIDSYVSCVTNELYAVFMSLISLITVFFYIDNYIANSKSNSNAQL
jgi:hypothetical protein